MVNSKPDSTEEFWLEQEKRLNSKIISYSLSQYSNCKYTKDDAKEFVLPSKKELRPIWGITFISELGIHFYHFPQQSWFTALTAKSKNNEEYSVDILFDDIKSWKIPEHKQSFLQKLFAPQDECIIVIQNEQAHAFNLDLRKKDILNELAKNIANKKVTTL